MVKIRYRIYQMFCVECEMQMELVNLMDDTVWRCLGCGKAVVVEVRTIRKRDGYHSIENQTRKV